VKVEFLLHFFLLQAIAGDTANTAVFLASDCRIHPLLKLLSSVCFAQQAQQMVSHATLKNILVVLVRLHSSLSLFYTEAQRKEVLYHSGTQFDSMERHAVIAWDAIQRHVFMDATNETSRCQQLEVVWNLDSGRLLAKVVTTLQDVLGPMDIQGHGFQVPQHGQIPSQIELDPPALQVQAPGISTPEVRTQTPKTSCEIAGITDRRFTGKVLCFESAKNFGFITCSELWEIFHKDVWVHKEQLHGFCVGQLVTFRVVINKRGHPQAVNLMQWDCMEFNQALPFSV